MSQYSKRRDLGLCVRCGEPSAPYSICGLHRFHAKVDYELGRLVDSGHAVTWRQEGQRWYKAGPNFDAPLPRSNRVRDDDVRLLPRVHHRPVVDIEDRIIRIMAEYGSPMAEDVLAQSLSRAFYRENTAQRMTSVSGIAMTAGLT